MLQYWQPRFLVKNKLLVVFLEDNLHALHGRRAACLLLAFGTDTPRRPGESLLLLLLHSDLSTHSSV